MSTMYFLNDFYGNHTRLLTATWSHSLGNAWVSAALWGTLAWSLRLGVKDSSCEWSHPTKNSGQGPSNNQDLGTEE